MTDWKLVEVTEEPAYVSDASGVYVTVHRIVESDAHKGIPGERIKVRVDLIRTDGDVPIRSWVGRAESVRKATMQWIGRQKRDMFSWLSVEHASYIGSEITRANLDPRYVQS